MVEVEEQGHNSRTIKGILTKFKLGYCFSKTLFNKFQMICMCKTWPIEQNTEKLFFLFFCKWKKNMISKKCVLYTTGTTNLKL